MTLAATGIATEIALIDLSSIAYPIFLMSGSQPNPDYTSTQIVDRIRGLTANHPHAAICCDAGRSFRHDVSPEYKANRPERDAALHHQITLAKERLEADGYPVWSVRGFEADDLIATATQIALGLADVSVVIMSADKDLLQLVGPRVRAMSVTNGHTYDEAAVQSRFGVRPDQIRDYLTLVGDSSDNVKGATGIGPKRAADLLAKYGSLEGIYDALRTRGTEFKPSIATALREFEPRWHETRQLVTLRTDVEIPFLEIDNQRTPKDVAPMETNMADTIDLPQPTAERTGHDAPDRVEAAKGGVTDPPGNAASPADATSASRLNTPTTLMAVREPDVLAPAPADFERQLEPRSLPQAMQLANHMHAARMFNGYGSPQAVLSTILAGRELGLQAIASLRGFHVIEGKHALAADAMRGLVLRSGQAKYFRVVERTPERATFETWRASDPEPVRLTYTIAEGYTAFKPELPEADRKRKWDASAWGKHPSDMCAARASSKLARLVYSDILFGLYAPEELRD